MVRAPIVRIAAETPLALGSASPRRREMMTVLGIPFVVCAANIDEALRAGESAHRYLDRIALEKLEAVRARGVGDASAVLVADTIVVSPDGAILGKPADASRVSGAPAEAEARAMIERLAGATHEVSTRFVLSEAAAGAPVAHSQTVTTRVTLRALAGDESIAYAATGEGTDKAGGYAVQGRAAAFIERIDGSYTNVVGLPLCEVVVAIRALGWW
jgi:septum formation protein